MNFLQDIWSRITGGRRREDEEERQRSQSAPAPAPIRTLPNQKPTRSLADFGNIVLPQPQDIEISAPPKPVQKALEPVPQPKPKPAPAPKPQPVAQAQPRQENALRRLSNSPFTKNVAAPALAGAARGGTGFTNFLLDYTPLNAINQGYKRLTGGWLTDRINQAVLPQAEALENRSDTKIPENIPLVGGEQPASLVAKLAANPFNALPLARAGTLATRAGTGALSGGAAGAAEPAENLQERASNTLVSALFGSGLGVLLGPRLSSAPARLADDIPLRSLESESPDQQLLRQLNREVQEQVGRTGDTLLDEPTFIRQQPRPEAVIASPDPAPPIPSTAPFPGTVASPDIAPPIPSTQPSGMVKGFDQQVAEFVADERIPVDMRQAIQDQAAKVDQPPQEALPGPAPVGITDVPTEAAIPNPANALPEAPPIVDPATLKAAIEAPAEVPTSLAEAPKSIPETTLFRGSKGNVEEINKAYQRILDVGDDQRSLIQQFADQGDGQARAILDDWNWTKADKYLRDKFSGQYDAIRYNNNQLPNKGVEYHDMESGQFLHTDRAGASVYARQNRGGKYVAGMAESPASPAPADGIQATNANIPTTGEIRRSTGTYARGQEYQATSREATQLEGSRRAANTSFDEFMAGVSDKGTFDVSDRATALALQERFPVGSPEHRMLGQLSNKVGTAAAQTLALIERTMRKTASADQLTNRFVNKLRNVRDIDALEAADDFAEVTAKNQEFTAARESLDAAVESFYNNGAKNADGVVEAFQKLDAADRAAKYAEYQTAARLLKGNSDESAEKLVRKLGQDAGVYAMSLADTFNLSSTRVMLNNFINTLTVRGEEQVLGKIGASLARKLTGANIGGGSFTGSRLGAKLGDKRLLTDIGLRQGRDENLVVRTMRNITTTGNSIGERNIQATAYAALYDHYRAALKAQGYTGDALKQRTLVNTLIDPDAVGYEYFRQSMANNALASTISNRAGKIKLETWISDSMAKHLGDTPKVREASQFMTRWLIGYPTVAVRAAQGGLKRAFLGTTTASQAVASALKGAPPEVTAQHIKNAVKEFGSGVTMYGLGGALSAAGLISGSYPSDPDDRAAWEREGRRENAINIGGNWVDLPQMMGVFALPLLMGATIEQNMQDDRPPSDGVIRGSLKTIIDAMPHDTLLNNLQLLEDFSRGRDIDSGLARTLSSTVRGVTPFGSLLNQAAKATDSTANELGEGDLVAQFVARVMDGIPGLANQLPNKEVEGQEIQNPGAIARFLGSTGRVQEGGVERTQEIAQEVDDGVRQLNEYGALSDNIRSILEEDVHGAFDRAKNGQPLREGELEALTKGMTKGVTTDADTAFLSNGDYESNLAVLKIKRDMLAKDPTTTKATLDNYDTQIKRGEIYQELQTPYPLIEAYRNTELTEWRDMADPESPDYDPDQYNLLAALDKAMTDQGVSRRSSDKNKPKYYPEKEGSGRGRGGSGGTGGNISAPTNMRGLALGSFNPQSIGQAKLPGVRRKMTRELARPRKITVS